MEFHISKAIRQRLNLDDLLFSYTGNVIFANPLASRKLAQALAALDETTGSTEPAINGGELFAMGLIDELSHALFAQYREEVDPAVLTDALAWFAAQNTPAKLESLLLEFAEQFPVVAVYRDQLPAKEWLEGTTEGRPNREIAFEEMMLLWLANSNPAFLRYKLLFGDEELKQKTAYANVTSAMDTYFETRPEVPELGTLLDALRAPILAAPDSITGQLDFIRERWAKHLKEDLRGVLLAIDTLREEELAIWSKFHPPVPGHYDHGAPGRNNHGFVGDEYVGFEGEFEYTTGPDGTTQRRRRYAADYQAPLVEYEAFSADQAWMPNVVLIAKSTYVWLEQLSKKYLRHIHRLDQIPDEELQTLARRGITGLWLIGLWERSRASQTIKRLCGNAEAVASAYSLKDYLIAEDLGGEAAYQHLREHAAAAGLRLASDMVPNHMGIDSDWVIEHPEWFLSRDESPFPVYTFNGPDLSNDSRVEIKLEDHYYNQSDAAVIFRLRHYRENRTRFVYHGNDGTTFAWNDTAQLDYSKASVREHVIQVILAVARRFPIIRFDAAMVLAKRHVQRLWFPLPGAGGSIPSRAENAMSDEEFNAICPHEFWREVVDRVAVEVPGTLLLAEAFWLLEGYFVRTLGMHRVYNSAFMNMLRDEENAKYRSYLIKTLEFDPDILKRYVNFMSNPDEKTATEQFGTGDKYFGVSVLLCTLPGLPMFGHGQVEGFTERYGMDFKQARQDEVPNQNLIDRHMHLIAPLLKNRQLFAESANFVMYDFWTEHGAVDENVFAYSNRSGDERGVIFYNNTYGSTHGTIHMSVEFLEKASGSLQRRSLGDGLGLDHDDALVIAYRDSVTGLEYLRRSPAVRHHGLTLSLNGYQHVVLLNWRQLRSTAEYPWDRLCDALNGSGVPSVDRELSRLRLRPVHEALRHAVNDSTIKAFIAATSPAASTLPEAVPLAAPAKLLIEIYGPVVDPSAPLASADPIDPKLAAFRTDALSVAHAAAALSWNVKLPEQEEPAASTSLVEIDEPEAIAVPSPLPGIEASLKLPQLTAEFPKSLSVPLRKSLPTTDPLGEPYRVWPVLIAWLALREHLDPASALAAFNDLDLRTALGELFQSVGLHGDDGWRAAARVAVLLRCGIDPTLATPTESSTFWKDPDVRWLIGANRSEDAEYFNKEQFEELVCLLQLPLLLDAAAEGSAPEAVAEIAASIIHSIDEAREVGYQIGRTVARV